MITTKALLLTLIEVVHQKENKNKTKRIVIHCLISTELEDGEENEKHSIKLYLALLLALIEIVGQKENENGA